MILHKGCEAEYKRRHEENEVDIITGGDVSCLMHLEGILKRKGSSTRVMHIAEILNSNL